MGTEPKPNSFRAAIIRGERPQLVVTAKEQRLEGDGDRLDAVAVPRSESRRGNHRTNDRHALAGEGAVVRYEGRRYDVEIVNLSAGGAKIRADFEPRLWDFLELQLCENNTVDCAVRWLRNGCIGLEFAHETRIDSDPEARATLLLEVIQRSFPGQPVRLTPAEEEEEIVELPTEELGQRFEKRHPLIWNGELHANGYSWPVRLRNISMGGALVDVEADLPSGTGAMLDLGKAGQLDATITWSGGEQAGLRFTQPFDVANLSKSRPEVTSHQWLVPDFLGNTVEESSPWHDNWTRSSIEEMRDDLEGYLKR